MLLLIVIIIFIACISILGNIYFNFFVFQQNYQDLNYHYNTYYGAISSIERGLLSYKHIKGGYQWNSENNTGETYMADNVQDSFGNIHNNYILNQNINSKTKYISGTIDYNTIVSIPLFINNSSDPYLNNSEYSKNFFEDEIYISGVILNNFSEINNDFILHWIITTHDGYIVANNTGNQITKNSLSKNFYFSKETSNIFDIESQMNSGFLTSWGIADTIGEALSGSEALQIHFFLTGGTIMSNDGIVPYLNFEIESNVDFSDLYYYIIGNSIVGRYQTNLFINKPTSTYLNPNQKNFIFPYYQ